MSLATTCNNIVINEFLPSKQAGVRMIMQFQKLNKLLTHMDMN